MKKKDIYNIICRPLLTEKGEYDRDARNCYHFEVDPRANKIEIREAVEKIYAHKGVKVKKVRIINKHPKERRFHFRQGSTRKWKKALVTLTKEHQIELF